MLFTCSHRILYAGTAQRQGKLDFFDSSFPTRLAGLDCNRICRSSASGRKTDDAVDVGLLPLFQPIRSTAGDAVFGLGEAFLR